MFGGSAICVHHLLVEREHHIWGYEKPIVAVKPWLRFWRETVKLTHVGEWRLSDGQVHGDSTDGAGLVIYFLRGHVAVAALGWLLLLLLLLLLLRLLLGICGRRPVQNHL